jgi:hypothetical protein
VKKTERKNKIFGGAWEQAMRIAYKAMKGGDVPPDYYRMETVWRDPSTPTYASKADAAAKLYAGGMGVIPRERARIDLGYTITEREEMAAWDKQDNPLGQLAGMYGTSSATKVPPSQQNPDNNPPPTNKLPAAPVVNG